MEMNFNEVQPFDKLRILSELSQGDISEHLDVELDDIHTDLGGLHYPHEPRNPS